MYEVIISPCSSSGLQHSTILLILHTGTQHLNIGKYLYVHRIDSIICATPWATNCEERVISIGIRSLSLRLYDHTSASYVILPQQTWFIELQEACTERCRHSGNFTANYERIVLLICLVAANRLHVASTSPVLKSDTISAIEALWIARWSKCKRCSNWTRWGHANLHRRLGMPT